MEVQWVKFDYTHKNETAPQDDSLVWINETFYDGVTIGYFDGFTFRVWTGSDDCNISHWAKIEYRIAPKP